MTIPSRRTIALCAVLTAGLQGVNAAAIAGPYAGALRPPSGPPKVQPAPDDWDAERSRREAARAAYLAEHKAAYDWFADFPFSQTDGIPLVLLKLFPLLSPERWQGGEAFLSSVGLFVDPRSDIDFLPRGIGFSGLAQDTPIDALDYTSFTCGGCHIGRVTDPNGETHYIDGGVNAEFNINRFYFETFGMLQDLYGGETNRKQQIAKLNAAVLSALETATETSPTFFYNDYKTDWKTYDATYEATQVELFRARSQDYVEDFAQTIEGFVDAYSYYLDKTYDGFQQEMLVGFPGMADATGISATNGFHGLSKYTGKWIASVILPKYPGVTDYMAVWDQGARAAEWDDKQKTLINGGGQYNGNIPIPVFRNIAAATTIGLDNPDMRVPAFGVDLLAGLPPMPYPFDVDEEKAKIGEALFAENCAACHQPHNGAVYTDLGTDPNRDKVINRVLMWAARREYTNFCPPDLELDLAGSKVKPCASYDGVSLKGRRSAVMRPLSDQRGYNATPLKGIWAVAPYLHTGSVPTMRHLLMPDTRPASFMKGRMAYDTENMGFSWQQTEGSGGVLFDTTAFHALNNRGHDTDITEGDTTYKLDWSDDPTGAEALIEYLKTL